MKFSDIKIEVDPYMPDGEIHLKDANDKVVSKIVNIGQPLMVTVVAFCRECLDQPGPVYYLNYKDINAVLEATRAWCRRNGASFFMQWTPFKDGNDEYGCCISFPTRSDAGNGRHSDPCHALMLACVEAARKAKGTT